MCSRKLKRRTAYRVNPKLLSSLQLRRFGEHVSGARSDSSKGFCDSAGVLGPYRIYQRQPREDWSFFVFSRQMIPALYIPCFGYEVYDI